MAKNRAKNRARNSANKWTMMADRGLDYTNTALLIDVDDCLVPSTVRELDVRKRRILWNLHYATDGAVILTTNSDMRSIDKMLSGFPCVSEHGSLYRLKQDDIPHNIAPALDVQTVTKRAFALAGELGLSATTKAEELHRPNPILKIEEKQASIALVFGAHAAYKEPAKTIVSKLHEEFHLAATHSIHIGTDAVEIAATGFAKVNALDEIMAHDNFRGRRPIVFGDSGPDRDMMARAFDRYAGLGVCVGDKIRDEPCVAMRAKNLDENWALLDAIKNEFVVGKSKCYGHVFN